MCGRIVCPGKREVGAKDSEPKIRGGRRRGMADEGGGKGETRADEKERERLGEEERDRAEVRG